MVDSQTKNTSVKTHLKRFLVFMFIITCIPVGLAIFLSAIPLIEKIQLNRMEAATPKTFISNLAQAEMFNAIKSGFKINYKNECGGFAVKCKIKIYILVPRTSIYIPTGVTLLDQKNNIPIIISDLTETEKLCRVQLVDSDDKEYKNEILKRYKIYSSKQIPWLFEPVTFNIENKNIVYIKYGGKHYAISDLPEGPLTCTFTVR